MAGLSPTQRTLKKQREMGRLAAITEKYNPHVGPHGIRQDLFGFIDIIALDPLEGVIAIQSCGSDFAAHARKLMEERNQNVFDWLLHAPVELWGWRKVKLNRGGKAMRWTPRIADVVRINEEEIQVRERK